MTAHRPHRVLDPVQDAYEIAAGLGGAHHGWYMKQLRLTDAELRRAVRSFEKQIEKHQRWIADPATKSGCFFNFDPRHQQALVVGWNAVIMRHRALIVILRGILEEREA